MVNQTAILKKNVLHSNATDLLKEIDWFNKVLETRVKLHFNETCVFNDIHEIEVPDHSTQESIFSEFLSFYRMTPSERLLLMLALLPHIYPQSLDVFFSRNPANDRGYTEFGGLKGHSHSGFLPTGETALFLLAGNDLYKRFSSQQLFDERHFFKAQKILWIASPSSGEPISSGRLEINEEYVDLFTGGKVRKPGFGMDFPAKLIQTEFEWSDLILDAYTRRQLNDIVAWLNHGRRLMQDWEMAKKLKPGYKAMFYGPPGTGKTLTAALFGKMTNKEVYRVDLSMVVSKYIGETEKNLEKVFTKAEHKNWILFFDEADALFGKRTSITDAHDKYANQEIAYLLQRLEDYNGLVILSSNMKNNLDEAFGRRLQSMVYFPVPKFEERIKLWEQTFSKECKFADNVDLTTIAEKFELSGGSIINIVQYSSLMALQRDENIIRLHDILDGIKKELRKEGKTV